MNPVMLIDLQDAREHLREDAGAADLLIESYIMAASASILTYIGDNAYTDENKTDVREDVKTACRLLVGDLYLNREGAMAMSVESRHGYGYLPAYVVALLFPYRDIPLG